MEVGKLLKLFQICFYTGILFTVVSLLLGQLFDFLNLDLDLDLDLDGDIFGVSVSPIKPIIIMSFITTLGGVGIICINKGINPLVSFLIALVVGASISTILHKFVVAPLYRAQNTSAISQQELIGYRAKTKINIIGDKFGSITYVVNGNTYSAPAKAIDGMDIYQGEEVKIVSIEKNIFFVVRV